MKVRLVIGSLKPGGAERQAQVLARSLAAAGVDISIIKIYHEGDRAVGDEPSHLDVKRTGLYHRRPKWRIVRLVHLMFAPFRLRSILIREEADIAYSMLYLTNLLARIATIGLRRPVLIWGIRASRLSPDWRRSIPLYLCRQLSATVPFVIANSKAGLRFHTDMGFRFRASTVIRNGIDVEEFRFDSRARHEFRGQLRIADDEILVGVVGRYDPVKGYEVFVDAARRLRERGVDLRFACIGPELDSEESPVRKRVYESGMENMFSLVGYQADMKAVYSALDVVVSASLGEGFTNVVAEAMACGRRCVVTDVGDSALIVDGLGIVVEPGEPCALAEAIEVAVNEREDCSTLGRRRIRQLFSIDAMATRTFQEMVKLSGSE